VCDQEGSVSLLCVPLNENGKAITYIYGRSEERKQAVRPTSRYRNDITMGCECVTQITTE
jgi:hypothetical protein